MKELQFSIGQQIEWVIGDIRRVIKADYICRVDYINDLFGLCVGRAAIAYLQEKKEIIMGDEANIGSFLKVRENNDNKET